MKKIDVDVRNLVVPLQKNVKSGQPYFTISGLGGHVIAFQILDKLVADCWRGYGVLYPGFLYESMGTPTIEGFAEIMLQGILAVQPHGPYLLVGYSMGGNICLEIARILKSRGEKVSIVLVDVKIFTHARKKHALIRFPKLLQWKLINFFRAISGSKAKHTRRLRENQLYRGENMPSVMPESFDRVIREGRSAATHYKMRPCDVPVVLIRCRDLIWYDDLYHWENDYAWGNYVDVREVLTTPGNHITMIKLPYAKYFVRKLEHAFELLLKADPQ